jgi:hypothetical protein
MKREQFSVIVLGRPTKTEIVAALGSADSKQMALGTSYEFAHFTDDELADGILAVCQTREGWSRDDLVAALGDGGKNTRTSTPSGHSARRQASGRMRSQSRPGVGPVVDAGGQDCDQWRADKQQVPPIVQFVVDA